MKYGDILLFKPTTFNGKLIAKIDGSPFSHTAFYLGEKDGVHLFIESHEKKGGVVITQLEDWKNYVVLRPKRIKPRPESEILAKLGTGYDFSMLGWILWAKILGNRNINNSDELLICSEFCDWAYKYKVGDGKVATPKTFWISKKFHVVHI